MQKLEKILLGGVLSIIAVILGFIASVIPQNTPATLGSGVLYIPKYVNTQVATSATTTIAAWPGVLHSITFNTPVSNSVVKLYDVATSTSSTVASSTLLETVTIPSSTAITPFTLTYDGVFVNGLTIVQSGATSTVTLNYQQQ